MSISPVNNAATTVSSLPLKHADQNINNKANHPAVAPENYNANDGDKDDKAIKKAAPVQPQESKSTVKQTINKFA